MYGAVKVRQSAEYTLAQLFNLREKESVKVQVSRVITL